ncbi:MAG: hypothetical protein V1717_03415, partial [Candidatus Micrarchaeota archaeon]
LLVRIRGPEALAEWHLRVADALSAHAKSVREIMAIDNPALCLKRFKTRQHRARGVVIRLKKQLQQYVKYKNLFSGVTDFRELRKCAGAGRAIKRVQNRLRKASQNLNREISVSKRALETFLSFQKGVNGLFVEGKTLPHQDILNRALLKGYLAATENLAEYHKKRANSLLLSSRRRAKSLIRP